MPRILLEDQFGEFIADRSKIVTESTEAGRSVKRIAGRISVCDHVNGNNRRYPRRVWEKNLQDGSILRKLIEKNAAWGLLEHPSDGKVDLRSPIAVRLVSIKLEESGDVTGEIRVLPTPEGMRLQALIDEGYNPTVSTRGYGSIKSEDGVDVVCEDYVCEGADVVSTPSVATAVMNPVESQQPARSSISSPLKPVTESSSSPQPSAAATSASAVRQSTQPRPMDIKQIRERLEVLRGVDATKLSPQRFAEGMTQFAELHREVSRLVGENPALQWDGSQLHEELTSQETSWAKHISDTKQSAATLRENGARLVKVATAVATTALTYKQRLSDAVNKVTRLTKLVEALTKRGQGWKRRSESVSAQLSALREDYQLATDGLDLLASKYNTDMVRVGRRLLELEFAEKVSSPDVSKLLKEAKHPDDLVRIREQHLSPKKPATPAANGNQPAPVETPSASTPAAPAVTEARAAAPVANVVAEGQSTAEVRGPINCMHESVGIARRLSESTAV